MPPADPPCATIRSCRVKLLGDEVIRRGDEVGEGVALVLAAALLVPGEALVLAAADVGDGIDEAAVDQRQRVRVEARRDRDAVGPVSVEKARSGPVEGGVAVVEEADGDALAVRRGGEDAPRDVVLRIVAGRHFLGLEQRALARPHVVVELLRRRRHRRIGEADDVRVVFERPLQAERIGFLVEGDGMFGPGRSLADDDAGQAVAPFQPDEEVAEGDVAQDEPPGLVRHDLPPVLPLRRVDRRLHDLEVPGAAGVGQHEEDVAALRRGRIRRRSRARRPAPARRADRPR